MANNDMRGGLPPSGDGQLSSGRGVGSTGDEGCSSPATTCEFCGGTGVVEKKHYWRGALMDVEAPCPEGCKP